MARSDVRFIAKQRLEAMGVQHVNKVFGMRMKNSKNRKLQKTYANRHLLKKILDKYQPLWKRVTTGDLAADGFKAFMGIGKRKRYVVTR